MKTEKQLKDRLEKLKWLINDATTEFYITQVKKIEIKREIYFLEEVLEIKHEVIE